MDLSLLIKEKQNYASQKMGSEYIIVPIKDNVAEMNSLINLNEVGSFIWDELKEGATVETIELAIVEEFEVPQELAKKDLAVFLEKLTISLNVR